MTPPRSPHESILANQVEIDRRARALGVRANSEWTRAHAVTSSYAAEMSAEDLAKWGLKPTTLVVRGPAHEADRPVASRGKRRRFFDVACSRCGRQEIRESTDLGRPCRCAGSKQKDPHRESRALGRLIGEKMAIQ